MGLRQRPGRADEEGAAEHINELSHRYNGEDYDMTPEHAKERVIVRITPERVTRVQRTRR